MRVKILVEPDLDEDYAEIHVRGMTEEVARLSEFIQNKNEVITGTDENERLVIIEDADIISIHAEKKWCRIHTDSGSYYCKKRMYEIEKMLGRNFMRI